MESVDTNELGGVRKIEPLSAPPALSDPPFGESPVIPSRPLRSSSPTPPGSLFSEMVQVDLDVEEDPALAHLREEYWMARQALEREHSENLRLLSAAFLWADVEPLATEPLNTGEHNPSAVYRRCPITGWNCPPAPGIPPLWSRPPLAVGAVPDRVSLIVNPATTRAGAVDAAEAESVRLKERGIKVTVLLSRYAGHERELAKGSLDTTILMLGGVGTTREVLNGVMQRPDRKQVQLAWLPYGKTPAYSVRDGIDCVLAGDVREMDVLFLEDLACDEEGSQHGVSKPWGIYSMSHGGWGAVASVARGRVTGRHSRSVGHPVKLKGKVFEVVKNSWYRTRLEFPDGELPSDMQERLAAAHDYTSVSYFNQRRVVGQVNVPRAQLDDGLMDLHIVAAGTRANMLKISNWAQKPEFNDPTQPCPARIEAIGLDYIQVSSISVWPCPEGGSHQRSPSLGPETVSVDGDVIGASPFRISVVPRAVRVFWPDVDSL